MKLCAHNNKLIPTVGVGVSQIQKLNNVMYWQEISLKAAERKKNL